MNYKLIPLKSFEKFIRSRDKNERAIIDNKLEILSKDPYNNDILDIKKLKGYENRYRLRVGKYRIIYEVYDEKFIIILADGGSRGGIY